MAAKKSITSLLLACMQLGAVLVAMPLASAPAHAGEWAYAPFDVPPATYTGDAGVRFWYGHSSTAKNLYDNTGSLMVSRLTYDGLSIYAAEAYARFDLNRRWFAKGYVGGGTLRNGSLTDEDFPPAAVPYSSTFSVQQNGSPIYADIDVGFNALFGPDFRIGLFSGLHYLNETVSAFGCAQAAFNPLICGPSGTPCGSVSTACLNAGA